MVVVLCDMVSSRSSPINITTLRPTVLAIFMEAVVYNEKQEPVTMTKEDEDAIREIELRFNEAWGRHDPDGMVESLSDDAQFVTVNGAWAKTRADFRDLMRRLHGANGPFRSSTRETPEIHVRFLAPDVAVMHTRFHIYGDVDESERTSIGIRVVRKLDGRWRTVAVHNTDVRAGRRH
jgi:uncharacterized protein (TIGR02246 family)